MSKGFGKFAIGAGIGAAITALFTTEKGKVYKEKITDFIDDAIAKLKEVDPSDVKDVVEAKIKEIKEDLKDLDAEKAKDIASEKAAVIEEKTKELVKYAKEKGTPVLQEMTENLRKEAIKATKKITKKLEGK